LNYFLHLIIINTILINLVIFSPTYEIFAQDKKLTKKQKDEVKELLFFIDVIDIRLQELWNPENDYGLANEKDNIYFENVKNVSMQISKRIKNLPNVKATTHLTLSANCYLDVGKMRLLTLTDGGYEKQVEIAKKYNIQDFEPHLWAYVIWQTAREFRNSVATELNLPIIIYSED
jgi:hypothetical protein